MRRYGALGLVWGVLAIGACASDEIDGTKSANQAPNVWLAAAPPEGSTGSYTVQLYWGGWDPDGEIAHYEYFITDNVTGVFDPDDTTGVAWNPVYGNDSTFVFSADSLAENTIDDQTVLFSRSHTFFIRAVDEEDMRSKEPAHRSFTSTTLSPEVIIRTPSAVLGLTPRDIPPISTIVWEAIDYVNDENNRQDPDSVQWAMVSTMEHGGSYAQTITYLQQNPNAPDWYPWSWYRAPEDSGKSWTTPPLEFGDYIFAIRAKDEAGAVTPVLHEPDNVRRIKVQQRLSGPTFVVTSDLVGSIIAATCDYPLTIVDVPAGVDLKFLLSACAEHYGGTVVGYRYGWDILDLDDPSQWETDYTPFIGSTASTPPREFNFGTHTFTAEVSDNSGFCSRIEVKVNIVRFTGDRNLLIVDDYKPDERSGQNGWVTTNGGVPSDAEHDGFWADMVSDLDGFDRTRDMIATSVDREIPLATIAAYKSIIWSVFGDIDTRSATDLPLLFSYIRYRSKRPPPDAGGACSPTGGVQGKVIPNVIGLAMQAGVHVIIAGNHPVQNVRPRAGQFTVRYPMIPLYELERENLQFEPNPDASALQNPPGDEGFAYRHLCLEVLDFGFLTSQRARQLGPTNNRRYCPTTPGYRNPDALSRRNDTMRTGIPLDPNFPPISLRPECSNPGRVYAPTAQGIDSEVYNPAYFRQTGACTYVPSPRSCFQPIYGLGCLDTAELTYAQPVAFWTSTFGNVVADDIVGAVAANSVVYGFPPVYFNPGDIKPGIEYIIFDKWQLPRMGAAASASK